MGLLIIINDIYYKVNKIHKYFSATFLRKIEIEIKIKNVYIIINNRYIINSCEKTNYSERYIAVRYNIAATKILV